MKINPAFDEVSLRWWNLTTKSVRRLALTAKHFRRVTTGNQRSVAIHARSELRDLCAARRAVHRCGCAY